MSHDAEAIFEQETSLGMRVWHLLFLVCGSVLGVVIMFCCCVRFRIPRTKQEIEADYQRKKLTRKFRERLDCMHNAEIDEMDLMKALDRVRQDCLEEKQKINENLNNQAINDVCKCV